VLAIRANHSDEPGSVTSAVGATVGDSAFNAPGMDEVVVGRPDYDPRGSTFRELQNDPTTGAGSFFAHHPHT
jgi:hypothetical protein